MEEDLKNKRRDSSGGDYWITYKSRYSSSFVETVVSLSHENTDSHIHVNIEFGEGDGKVPVDKIAQKAEII